MKSWVCKSCVLGWSVFLCGLLGFAGVALAAGHESAGEAEKAKTEEVKKDEGEAKATEAADKKDSAAKAQAHDQKDGKKSEDKKDEKGEKHDHKGAKVSAAHSHGEAQVKLAWEKDKVHVHIDLTQESLVGFEHKPKNDAEKKALDDAVKKVTSAMLLAWDSELGCEEVKASSNLVYEGKHAEVKFKGEYSCKALGKGKNLTFKIKEVFSKVGKVHVEKVSADGKASKHTFETATFDVAL